MLQAITMDLRDPHTWRAFSSRQLATQLAEGHPIDRASIQGWVYRGISLGLPRFVEALSWVNFAKTFTHQNTGWNIRCEQHPLDKPSVYKRNKQNKPVIFGRYALTELDLSKCPRPCGPGLLIDYSINGTARGRGTSPRDPIVSVFAGEFDYLLGWSYLDLGWTRLSTPSYFLLIRDRPLDHEWIES